MSNSQNDSNEQVHSQEAIKPSSNFKYGDGKVSFKVELKDDVSGAVVGYNDTQVDAVAIFKAVAEGSENKIDDALIPYVEMLAKLLPKKE